MLPAVAVPMRYVRRVLALGKRFERMRDAYRETGGRGFGRVRTPDGEEAALVSVIEPEQPRATLREFFDEDGFLSPHGLRSVSKRYENNPYVLDGVPGAWIDYEPAESTTTMFGGNSNWRGPVWLPVNGRRRLQAGVPDRLGQQRTFGEIAQDLADRIVAIWLPGPDGRRPLYGGVEKLQTDPAWKDNLLFNEYFHGDNGAGLGAAHQTGWTALVVDLILAPPSAGRERERMERRELLSRARDLRADAGAARR